MVTAGSTTAVCLPVSVCLCLCVCLSLCLSASVRVSVLSRSCSVGFNGLSLHLSFYETVLSLSCFVHYSGMYLPLSLFLSRLCAVLRCKKRVSVVVSVFVSVSVLSLFCFVVNGGQCLSFFLKMSGCLGLSNWVVCTVSASVLFIFSSLCLALLRSMVCLCLCLCSETVLSMSCFVDLRELSCVKNEKKR